MDSKRASLSLSSVGSLFSNWRWSPLRWIPLALAGLLLAGCATGLGGGYGYPGGYGQRDGYGQRQSVYGTVLQVDNRRDRIIVSRDDGYGRDSRLTLHYDRNTRLFYQGRQLAVEGLERGDGIRVNVVRTNGRLWARTIEVVRNVRDGYRGDRNGDRNQLRGAVVYVDPRARVIALDRRGGYGGQVRVRYDHRTVVEYRGRRYRPENLERGDIVRIQARRWGNGWLAERVWVERDSTYR